MEKLAQASPDRVADLMLDVSLVEEGVVPSEVEQLDPVGSDPSITTSVLVVLADVPSEAVTLDAKQRGGNEEVQEVPLPADDHEVVRLDPESLDPSQYPKHLGLESRADLCISVIATCDQTAQCLRSTAAPPTFFIQEAIHPVERCQTPAKRVIERTTGDLGRGIRRDVEKDVLHRTGSQLSDPARPRRIIPGDALHLQRGMTHARKPRDLNPSRLLHPVEAV